MHWGKQFCRKDPIWFETKLYSSHTIKERNITIVLLPRPTFLLFLLSRKKSTLYNFLLSLNPKKKEISVTIFKKRRLMSSYNLFPFKKKISIRWKMCHFIYLRTSIKRKEWNYSVFQKMKSLMTTTSISIYRTTFENYRQYCMIIREYYTLAHKLFNNKHLYETI